MSSDRNIVRNCAVITKVGSGSDHTMVRAISEINKMLMRLKNIHKYKSLRQAYTELENAVTLFKLELQTNLRL